MRERSKGNSLGFIEVDNARKAEKLREGGMIQYDFIVTSL